MRRGLIAHSKVELPDAVFDARLERLRAAMAGLDALLVYTNNTRPAGVSWLVGFIPYWSEAMLVLPRSGPPVLVVALTFRVKPWIERTSRVAEVIFTPRIGIETARLIAAKKADAAVGVVDFDSPLGRHRRRFARGRPAPRILRRQRAVRSAARHRRSRRDHADGAGLVDRGQRLVPHRPARARHRRDRGGGRRRGAPARRRRGLRGGGARPRPRPAARAHRKARSGEPALRRAFRGARERRLQGQLGAPRGDDRPRPHGARPRRLRPHSPRPWRSCRATARCRNSPHSWWKDAGWRSRSRH